VSLLYCAIPVTIEKTRREGLLCPQGEGTTNTRSLESSVQGFHSGVCSRNPCRDFCWALFLFFVIKNEISATGFVIKRMAAAVYFALHIF
jgi:hypothetical protein